MRAVFRALGHGKLQLTPANHVSQVERYMIKFMADIKDVMRTYPPVPPPPNRYKRTGKLGFGWIMTPISTTAGGLSIRLVNYVKYAPFVQGQYQRWYHARTGWKVLQDNERRSEYNAGLRSLYRQFRIEGG